MLLVFKLLILTDLSLLRSEKQIKKKIEKNNDSYSIDNRKTAEHPLKRFICARREFNQRISIQNQIDFFFFNFVFSQKHASIIGVSFKFLDHYKLCERHFYSKKNKNELPSSFRSSSINLENLTKYQ